MQKKVNKYKQIGAKTVVNCSNLIERRSWSPVTNHLDHWSTETFKNINKKINKIN